MAEGAGADVEEDGAPEAVAEDLPRSSVVSERASRESDFLSAVSEAETVGGGVDADAWWVSDMVTS